MHRHHRRLGNAEDVEGEENPERGRAELAGKNAAGGEVESPGDHAGPGDRRQEEHGRGAEEGEDIDATADPRRPGAAMGDERVGREGE